MIAEEVCQRCGGPNVAWFVSNELWNRVNPPEGILCPSCFVRSAEAAGIRPTGWQLTPEQVAPPKALAETELWAWLGEDDQANVAQRTGAIGLKQAITPAGYIPMVAVVRQKMEKFAPTQFEAQAKRYGKKIRLCRFVFAEVVQETEHGE